MQVDESDGPAGKDVLMPVWNRPDPYFEALGNVKRLIPPKNPWRIAPDDKHVPTHKMARTRKCLVAVHPNAIAIGAPAGSGSDAILGWIAIVFLTLFAVFLLLFLSELLNDYHLDYFLIDWCLVFSSASLLGAIWFYNDATKMPSDFPIIFNRKNRTVSFARPNRPKFFKFWEFTKSGFFTYSWDDVKVRSYKVRGTNAGKSFHESFWLVLLWGNVDESGRTAAKDGVSIGYVGYFEDERLFQVWEHIRRYMEEGGPPIQPGERLRKPANNRKPAEFPPEVIAAAGGPALSEAEVERLAGIEAEVRQEEPSDASA